MLKRVIFRAKTAVATRRFISHTRVLGGGQTTMAAMLGSHPSGSDVPTADYLMTVEQAAQMMAEMHLGALPVVKNEKVVGVFTEHDYVDKVLNMSHSAVRTSKVSEVASMGSDLVVAYPEDTVAGCLEVMTIKKLNAIPVVEHDGHVMGMVSMMELTKEMFASQDPTVDAKIEMDFSQPSHFPENITAAGGGFHDDITMSQASPEKLHELYDQLKHDLEMSDQHPTKSFDAAAAEHFNLDPNLDEMAAQSFSEASTFPEFTPSEDGLLTQTHGADRGEDSHLWSESKIMEQEERYAVAQGALLNEMPHFSEPSDFPEVLPIEEMLAARKREGNVSS